MNAPIIIASLCILALALFLWISYRNGTRVLKAEKIRKDEADRTHKACLANEKLGELRVVAEREKVNLIELAHSVDPDLVNHLSLADIVASYSSLPEGLRKKVSIGPGMCSTFRDFWTLVQKNYPLSEKAAEKMYSLQDFWPLENLKRSGRLIYENIYYRVYRPKFYAWLNTVQSCAEIARLGSWDLNCDYVTSSEWAPACSKFVNLCRKEMENCNDLPTLWQLRRNAQRCSHYDVYVVEKELFQKILSLTHDLNELKRLANPKTYDDRVETETDLAEEYYIKTIESLLLKCRSMEDLRSFLSSHEIPMKTKPLSLRIMAELPEHSGIPTR